MKYTVDIEIDRSRDEVIAAFDNADNLSKWQEGLESFEHLSGEPGQTGAQAKLVFDLNGRRMEMIENITERRLPDEFNCTYDAPNVHNIVSNRFEELAPDKTRWISENEFQFKGAMRLIGWFLKSAFPKQSLKYMKDFKAFIEDGVNVNDAEADRQTTEAAE